MAYGLNVEMHKQVSFTDSPSMEPWCGNPKDVSQLSAGRVTLPSPQACCTNFAPRELATRRYLLHPSFFVAFTRSAQPWPRLLARRAVRASVNVSRVFAQVIKRGISLSRVHGRINICDDDSTTWHEGTERKILSGEGAGTLNDDVFREVVSLVPRAYR